MRRRILPTILFWFLLLVLCLPLLNMLTGIIESGPLMGSVTLRKGVDFSVSGWFNGNYQAEKEGYVNDNIGFRPDFVRVVHQIDYSAFGKLHEETVVQGSDGYLHSNDYIRALNGGDFMGRDSIRNMVRRLRFISDTLRRLGKPLIFAFSPSKARFLPETLPTGTRKPPTHETNYEVILSECRTNGIYTMDFNGWFLSMKGHSPHPLFYRQGIHWSRWMAGRAADSFNRFLGALLHRKIASMRFGEVSCGQDPAKGENDIGQALNLIWPSAKDTFCYTHIDWERDSTTSTPDVIFLADSFFWTWINDGVPNNAYGNWDFWYYFNDMWNRNTIAGNEKPRSRYFVDWPKMIESSDAFVLFFAEPNLASEHIAFFVNEAYAHFGGH